ncbi:glycosyltransferase family A protein [Aquimarina agarilytica]|uniref:glycosyltransferase family A protein n=1 Tax=Aquimarina agarilytica TaxID=1087449 RepID=UPI0002892145|nr:glycosyltransferase family A protein [Aquimarina agarilytica]
MNKIIYSFWSASIKERWSSSNISTDEILKSSIRCLYLSVLYAKKWGFEVEIFTHINDKHYFSDLPADNISCELTFLTYTGTWTEAKIIAISKQTTPFVHIDWDVFLVKKEIASIIKNCTSDVIIESTRKSIKNGVQKKDTEISTDEIYAFQHLVDLSPFFIDEFHKPGNHYCNTAIIGFNNLKIRDQYVSEFYKCLAVCENGKHANFSRILDQYLLFCVLKSTNASLTQVINNNSEIENLAKNIGYTHFTSFSKYSKTAQQKIERAINDKFPDFSFLIQKKSEEKKPLKISLCTVVKNRFDHVVITLKHNIGIAKKYAGQIDLNILDYNSTDGLEAYLFEQPWFLEAIENNLLTYYKNYDAKYYHRTLPKNNIHFLAKGAYLINIDADNFIDENYLDYCLQMIENEHHFFLRPSHQNSAGAFGRIMIHHKDFKKIGGYNLNIENYGFEDSEITLRLKKLGVKQLLTPNNLHLAFIDHDDKLRVANEKPMSQYPNLHYSKYESQYHNRNLAFKLFPNQNNYETLKLYKIDHKRNKIDVKLINPYQFDH